MFSATFSGLLQSDIGVKSDIESCCLVYNYFLYCNLEIINVPKCIEGTQTSLTA